MEDENAFTLTMCIAQVSRDRWSKYAYRIPSERRPNASDLIAFCEFRSFSVEVQTNARYIHAMHA